MFYLTQRHRDAEKNPESGIWKPNWKSPIANRKSFSGNRFAVAFSDDEGGGNAHKQGADNIVGEFE